MSKPFVSIWCITYNHEKFIAEALDSFLMQKTNFPFEIVIDDDCSTDKTAKIIQKYAAKFPNIIKAHLRKINVGPHENGLGCLRRTKGEYIALCEGDDCWIDSNKLQYQIDKMKQYPECNISFHPSAIKNELNLSLEEENRLLEDAKEILQIIDNTMVYGKPYDSDKIIDIDPVITKGGGFMPTCSIIIKKSCLLKFDMFFNSYFSDYIMQILGSLEGGALYINNMMSTYRMHTNGLSSSTITNEEKLILHESTVLDALIELDTLLDHKYHHLFKPLISSKTKLISQGKKIDR